MIYPIVRTILAGWTRLTGCPITGRQNIPKDGPAIIICNHNHNMDPVFLAMTTPRQIHYMAKKEFFEIKIVKLFFDLAGAFPVSRGEGDLSAVKNAMAILRQNKLIGIFPEGTRGVDESLEPFQKGVALIAYKAQVPVIPVAIRNSQNLFAFWKKRPAAQIGQPIYLPTTRTPELLEEYTSLFEQEVAKLRALLYDMGSFSE